MDIPDLSQKQAPIKINGRWIRFSKIEYKGETWYLPRGLSLHPDGLLRFYNNEMTHYVHRKQGSTFKEYLEYAWTVWCHNQWKNETPPGKFGRDKMIDSGMAGVIIAVDVRNDQTRPGSAYIVVIETVKGKPFRAHVSSRVIHNVDQQWIDENLKIAIAIRRTFEERKDQNQGVGKAVTIRNYDEGLIPSVLPRKVFLSELKDRHNEILIDKGFV